MEGHWGREKKGFDTGLILHAGKVLALLYAERLGGRPGGSGRKEEVLEIKEDAVRKKAT